MARRWPVLPSCAVAGARLRVGAGMAHAKRHTVVVPLRPASPATLPPRRHGTGREAGRPDLRDREPDRAPAARSAPTLSPRPQPDGTWSPAGLWRDGRRRTRSIQSCLMTRSTISFRWCRSASRRWPWPRGPVPTLADLIAHGAKAKPGTLNYSTAGHRLGLAFRRRALAVSAGFRRSTFRSRRGMADRDHRGRIDFKVPPVLRPPAHLVRDGKLVALAVSARKRVVAAADVPTIIEAGVTGRRDLSVLQRSSICRRRHRAPSSRSCTTRLRRRWPFHRCRSVWRSSASSRCR